MPLTDKAIEYLVKHAIDLAILADVGVTERDGRLVYPTGRSSAVNGNGPKALQPKGAGLELWWPKGEPRDGATVVLAEGESDALAILSVFGLAEILYHDAPGENPFREVVVASMPGTGYPIERKLADELAGVDTVVLGFDGDDAGRKATARAAGVLAEAGIACHDLAVPEGLDVAECLAELGPDDRLPWLARRIHEARPADPPIHSATKELPVAERISGLPFSLAGDVIANAPPEPEWVWEGYIAPGEISLIAGRPKVGKSTLVFGLIAAILHGRRFVGRATRGRGVLLLTEEGAGTFAEKARRFGIQDHSRFHVLLRRRTQAGWLEIASEARAYCARHGLDVLVVDTFDKWSGLRGDDENKSGPVIAALEPLMMAAGDNLAVVVISHQRKASGEHGEAVRGSNALTGSVDVILEVERVRDVAHARALVGTSRHASTPEELAIELTDDGYADCGDVEALKGRLETDKILERLSDEAITASAISEATEIPEGTVRHRLDELRTAGRVERTGEGRKGSPYAWKMLSATAHPLVAERKNESANGHGHLSDDDLERIAAEYGEGA